MPACERVYVYKRLYLRVPFVVLETEPKDLMYARKFSKLNSQLSAIARPIVATVFPFKSFFCFQMGKLRFRVIVG